MKSPIKTNRKSYWLDFKLSGINRSRPPICELIVLSFCHSTKLLNKSTSHQFHRRSHSAGNLRLEKAPNDWFCFIIPFQIIFRQEVAVFAWELWAFPKCFQTGGRSGNWYSLTFLSTLSLGSFRNDFYWGCNERLKRILHDICTHPLSFYHAICSSTKIAASEKTWGETKTNKLKCLLNFSILQPTFEANLREVH